ncbi:PSD1 and planctomycete cytochrome C domain-containing protein [Isosphaeraceae bacterium EP7]
MVASMLRAKPLFRLAFAASILVQPSLAAEDHETAFELTVRPVLASSCVKCHGPTKQSGSLRLDSREAMLKGGDNGPAIVPGNPGESLLIQAISQADDALKMPPNKPLAKDQREALEAWIAAGAIWPESKASSKATIEGENHWAFEPFSQNKAPDDPSGWAQGAIDQWIAAGQRSHGVRPVEQAERRILIRRASFDLTGLPPSPEQVEAFARDVRPDAFARLIDELLASPQYGERWGRYWLDLARYADTAGDNSDYPIPQAYLYRDYVIDAFNADIPYDRFLHEQLAGDILAPQGPPEDYNRRVIATGFVAQAKRFGTVKLEDTHQIIEDTLNTTGQTVLGLSLRCARCHDHKFDPISAKDYYALYGVFAGTKYPFAGAEEDKKPSEFAPLALPAVVKSREAEHAATIARMSAEVEQAVTLKRPDGEINALKAALTAKQKESPHTGLPWAYAVREGTPTDVKLQVGGDPTTLGDLVPRGVPLCLDAGGKLPIPEGQSGRLQLAQWLTDGPPKPLTARVMVNRIWQHHFGKPIVATPSDFGLRGTPPTHPELLDELARQFVESGWSIKAMHRRIMLSRTYQLATVHDSAAFEADAGNTWYWRGDRRQLDAESLRDSLLALGGDLDLSRPGPHAFPPVAKWTYTAHHQFKAVYPSNHRSVYLMVQRLHAHPYLSLFNGPDTSMTTPVRDASAVPLQSLFLLNNPFVHEQAERFAKTLIASSGDQSVRVDLAFRRVYARGPSAAELAKSTTFLAAYEAALDREGVAADRRPVEAWASLARSLLASNEFHYVD